ncbi:MAG: Fe-S cluster assembly protein SufD [Gemmatimonadetes bacterium]|nr:Fe-S cluster assembly protein SufD [Gemmatimonadota bacterium]
MAEAAEATGVTWVASGAAGAASEAGSGGSAGALPAVEGITAAIHRGAVEALAADEPTWLRDRRLEAWSVYERTPMPTTRLEEWRYTDLRRKLKLDRLKLLPWQSRKFEASRAPVALVAAMAADEAASGHVIEIDGAVAQVDLLDELRSKGVILGSLRGSVRAYPDLLEPLLATEAVPATLGKFQALNAALWTDGTFLFVPSGVRLDLPVRVSRWFAQPGRAVFSRTLIVAEAGSQVSFVDEALSSDFAEQTFVSSAVEVFARDGAQIQYVSLQRMGWGAFHLSQQRTIAQRDATLDTLNVSLGGSVSRVDLSAELRGPGANSDMLGVYFGERDQHFDHNTRQDHIAPNAKSDLLYKGALDGKSRGVFRGIIKVHKGAQRTDAYQTNRNLLLSKHARAESLPRLEIEADDVRCSHGATVGQLEEEHVFYLMSRGLTRPQAERLVVTGFLEEVLSRLPLGGVVEKVTGIIEERLRG